MFTGIVHAVGEVLSLQQIGGDIRLSVTSGGLPWNDYVIGDSISVSGVCLTAVALDDRGFAADCSSETMAVTALGDLRPGSRVNLEPAVALGDRLGGHIVSGHVDCVGVVKAREQDARSVRLVVGIPAEYQRYMAKKGSVCLDGVSLTVNEVSDSQFEVNIIPHTAEVTTIGDLRVGARVNIEVDLLARYLERLLSGTTDSGISKDFLRAHGYD